MLIRNKVARSNIGRTRVIPAGIAGRDFSTVLTDYTSRVMSVRPNNLVGAWQLNETSGFKATNLKTGTFTGELGSNGDIERGTAYWEQQVGTGVIADEAVFVHSGGKAAKLTAGATANTYIFEPVRCNSSSEVVLKFWTSGDGVNAGRYAIRNFTTAGWIIALVTTGITALAYSEITVTINVPATCNVIQLYFYCPAAAGGIVYFDDITVIGTVSSDGGYGQAAGTIYGEPGIGDGKTSIKLAGITGTSSGIMIGSGQFNSVWNGDVGTAMSWGRMDAAATWADITIMRYLFHIKTEADPTYYVVFGHGQVSQQIEWRRRVGGAIYTKSHVFGAGPLGWFCMAYRWDVTSTPKNMAGFVYAPGHTPFTKVFDEVPGAGIGDGAWGIHPVRIDAAALGGGLFSVQVWRGWQAHAYYWAGAALTDAEILKIMMP